MPIRKPKNIIIAWKCAIKGALQKVLFIPRLSLLLKESRPGWTALIGEQSHSQDRITQIFFCGFSFTSKARYTEFLTVRFSLSPNSRWSMESRGGGGAGVLWRRRRQGQESWETLVPSGPVLNVIPIVLVWKMPLISGGVLVNCYGNLHNVVGRFQFCGAKLLLRSSSLRKNWSRARAKPCGKLNLTRRV